MQHGNIPALGYRIGDAAYTPDVSDIPRESFAALEGLELWIIDALRYAPHPSHFSLDDALGWIDRFKPRRAVLTNLHSDLDYRRGQRQALPTDVVAGYDGMRLTLETRHLARDELRLNQLRHPEVRACAPRRTTAKELAYGPSSFEGHALHGKSDLSDLRPIQRTQPA